MRKAKEPLTIIASLPMLFFFQDFIYLFIFREGKGGRKRRRETSVCGCLSQAPFWGPDLQPRHVPSVGIKTAILWFTGQHSIHWTTTARANCVIFDVFSLYLCFPNHMMEKFQSVFCFRTIRECSCQKLLTS